MDRQRILEAVNRDAEGTIERLCQSIAVSSVTGTEGPVAAFYADELHELGLEVHLEYPDPAVVGDRYPYWDKESNLDARPNVIARWRTGRPGGPIVINGHTDTVPVQDPSRWSTNDPFKAEIRDGNVFGRGAADMKGGLAAAVAAVRALKRLGIEPARDLELQFVIAEEARSLGMLTTLCRDEKPAALISLEPSNMAISRAEASIYRFDLEVEGQAMHTSCPWLGVSAFEKLWLIYEGLERANRKRWPALAGPLWEDYPQAAPFAIGVVRAGYWGFMVPDRADATGRWATVPPATVADARAELERAVSRIADYDPWLRTHRPIVRPFGDLPGWETPADDPLIRALSDSYRAVGGTPHMNGVLFGTDASWVAAKYGDVPMAVFGPGFIGNCHIDDESVSIGNVLDTARVLALTLSEWSPV